MKKFFYILVFTVLVYGCKTTQSAFSEDIPIITTLDLANVQEDKVKVTVDPAEIQNDSITFYIPKIVPGTYMNANFGQYVEEFKALDDDGNELDVVALSENSWRILDASELDKVSYLVNDTFDVPGEGGIYSMAGTNILEGENFLLNLHGFVGYFRGMKEEDYHVNIIRPEALIPGSALNVTRTIPTEQEAVVTDIYELERYFQVVDNPIMYAPSDTVLFKVQDMQVLLDVYSPNNQYTAMDLKPGLEEMMAAQKRFLGDIDNTNKYAILLYLSDSPGEGNAGIFGALEHHTSTVVVLPEMMSKAQLESNMTDIVSHEFFHIVTPLGVHSKEIHYFDYNEPEMSKHLWMYEGVTEYFANLFQVNQGLINEEEFYQRMHQKILTSRNFDDTMSFTKMSENILEPEYQQNYINVYQKGALIGMALDIRLRELSNGRDGLLGLMKELTEQYGKEKPFEDDYLIPTIVGITYPEIRQFFEKYVTGTTPIPYENFFQKVGLELQSSEVPVGYFLKDQTTPYITLNSQNEIVVRNNIELNSFHKEVGLQPDDVIKSINGTPYSRENVYALITASMGWKEGDPIKMTIERNGNQIILESEVTKPMAAGMKLVEMSGASDRQIELRYAWLKGN